MKTSSTPQFEIPQLCTFKQAWELLCCGESKGYELIESGELVSANVAGKRVITGESIRRYLEKSFSDPKPLKRSIACGRLNPKMTRRAERKTGAR